MPHFRTKIKNHLRTNRCWQVFHMNGGNAGEECNIIMKHGRFSTTNTHLESRNSNTKTRMSATNQWGLNFLYLFYCDIGGTSWATELLQDFKPFGFSPFLGTPSLNFKEIQMCVCVCVLDGIMTKLDNPPNKCQLRGTRGWASICLEISNSGTNKYVHTRSCTKCSPSRSFWGREHRCRNTPRVASPLITLHTHEEQNASERRIERERYRHHTYPLVLCSSQQPPLFLSMHLFLR